MKRFNTYWRKFAKLQSIAQKKGDTANAAKLAVVNVSFQRRALQGDFTLSENIEQTYRSYKKSIKTH